MSPSTITLITGANQGIGLAAAKALARDHGHHVIIGSRNADAGAKAAEEIRADGHAASSVQLDLGSDESIAAAVKTIDEQFGRLDVLISKLRDTSTAPMLASHCKSRTNSARKTTPAYSSTSNRTPGLPPATSSPNPSLLMSPAPPA